MRGLGKETKSQSLLNSAGRNPGVAPRVNPVHPHGLSHLCSLHAILRSTVSATSDAGAVEAGRCASQKASVKLRWP
jgi:hypothetical protein